MIPGSVVNQVMDVVSKVVEVSEGEVRGILWQVIVVAIVTTMVIVAVVIVVKVEMIMVEVVVPMVVFWG